MESLFSPNNPINIKKWVASILSTANIDSHDQFIDLPFDVSRSKK